MLPRTDPNHDKWSRVISATVTPRAIGVSLGDYISEPPACQTVKRAVTLVSALAKKSRTRAGSVITRSDKDFRESVAKGHIPKKDYPVSEIR
jgi:hypothetical protein